MLLDQLLVARRAALISSGIAPAINEVPAFAVLDSAFDWINTGGRAAGSLNKSGLLTEEILCRFVFIATIGRDGANQNHSTRTRSIIMTKTRNILTLALLATLPRVVTAPAAP